MVKVHVQVLKKCKSSFANAHTHTFKRTHKHIHTHTQTHTYNSLTLLREEGDIGLFFTLVPKVL